MRREIRRQGSRFAAKDRSTLTIATRATYPALMPTLEFKGKQHIYAHHLTVPYSPLVVDPQRSHPPAAHAADTDLVPDDNLIIHGDNLRALKALLPRYAGKVNCIYIDPPYNTGNEGWSYNDNVNSPLMQQWLKDNGPVDDEDLERHDKWLCMMWPRLQLLRELLADDGVVFVSIDENEEHHLRMLMDGIFGDVNFLNSFAWVNNLKGRQLTGKGAARTHEPIFAYAKDAMTLDSPFQIDIGLATEVMPDAYRIKTYEEQHDEVGPYVIKNQLYNTNSKFNEKTAPTLVFNIHYSPNEPAVRFTDIDSEDTFDGFTLIRPRDCRDGIHSWHAWRWSQRKIAEELHDLHFEKHGDGYRIYTKVRDFRVTAMKDLITNLSNGNDELKQLGVSFPSPKPSALIKALIGTVSSDQSIILDSFAGSGTTGHATLALNGEDGGNRRFILIECLDYADTITAERVRRVIDGVPRAKNEALREGLGGSFTYCTLGDPFDAESLLSGEGLPDYETLAIFLLHTAAGLSLEPDALRTARNDQRFYRTETTDYYLYYEPDIEWLKSDEAMLTPERAKQIETVGKPATVFGAGKYLSQRELTDMGITFCQLPYELFKGG